MRKIEALPDATLESLREVSRHVFNNQYRLEIACVIGESAEGRVFAHGLAKARGVTDKVAGEELRRLEKARLLAAIVPDDPGQKRQYFSRQESSYWDAMRRFADEIAER